MTAVIASLGAALIAAAVSIVSLCLQRKWKKDDQSAGKLDAISTEVQSVKNTLTEHIATDAEADAKQARRRIIDFSDECRRGTRHSEEHFDNVLEDIDAYEKYCAAHPQFENRKAVQSIRFIVEIYDECKRKNDFI
ncbi:MAG: hypothetical protein IIW73_02150 [Clostridia bacterium]|nr:hypothetical protein [Clostridia bacterium]